MPNRLAASNSPYLLQHADNPVDWWEWGDEAFAEAVARDVPVFLSVGYSACHWCHVMAHESFEDEATARILNDGFVSIKVDREVRPDVDAVYMAATQALAGQGGWPMSVWLDHDRQPFHAGTYFPPQPLPGRASFTQVLEALSDAWRTRRDEVVRSAGQVTAAVVAHVEQGARHRAPDDDAAGPPDEAMLSGVVDLVVDRAWDRDLGGFGRAPKFPQAMLVQFLLDHHVVTGHVGALEAAVSSLDAMARGGIHDHVVGGFARYSTDARWLLPHFEKMLYDNGLLLEAYATAAVVTGRPDLRAAAEGIAGWLVDAMQAPDGGFHAALDADTDGEEGATTVWGDAEFREVVGDAGVDPDLAAAWFGVRAQGNFRPERGAPAGDNILHTPVPLVEFATAHGLDVEEWQVQVRRMTSALAQRRALRPQPGLDDKVIVGWNALAIRGLARASALLGRDEWAAAALRSATFLHDHVRDRDGGLLHVHRAGTSWIPAFLDDQAGLALALVELAPVVGRPDLVAWAIDLVDDALEAFAADGGWSTTRDGGDLVARPRDDWDNAQPAGTSLLARACLALGAITGSHHHTRVATEVLADAAPSMAANPTGYGELLRAAQARVASGHEVAIVGPPGPARDALAGAVLARPRPGTVAVVADAADDARIGLLVGRDPDDGVPRAWVCRDFACDLPVATAAQVLQRLDG